MCVYSDSMCICSGGRCQCLSEYTEMFAEAGSQAVLPCVCRPPSTSAAVVLWSKDLEGYDCLSLGPCLSCSPSPYPSLSSSLSTSVTPISSKIPFLSFSILVFLSLVPLIHFSVLKVFYRRAQQCIAIDPYVCTIQVSCLKLSVSSSLSGQYGERERVDWSTGEQELPSVFDAPIQRLDLVTTACT